MAFSRAGGVNPGDVSKILDTPAQQLEQRTPQVQEGGFFDDLPALPEGVVADQPTPDGNSNVSPQMGEGYRGYAEGEWDQIAAEQDRLAQQQELREQFPEQIQQETRIPINKRFTESPVNKWEAKKSSGANVDGGFRQRMGVVASNIGNPDVSPIAAQSNIGQVLIKSGAALSDMTAGGMEIDGTFKKVLAAVVENFIASKVESESDPFDIGLEPEKGSDLKDRSFGEQREGIMPTSQIKKSEDATSLGQEIHREYQRVRNDAQGKPTDQYTDLAPEDAAFLGDYAKEIYAASMGDSMPRYHDTQGNVVFGVTSDFQRMLAEGKAYRQLVFPKEIVRASKSPTPQGKLMGEQGKYKKPIVGQVGKGRITAPEAEEARKNQGSVGHVVDKQRLKILLLSMLPALTVKGEQLGQDQVLSMFAEVTGFGESKLRQFQGVQALKDKQGYRDGEEPYNAYKELQQLKRILAQQLFGIAQERNGVNYLTYNMQAFNGRFTPNQSLFNPTTSKLVRFVTRSPKPSIVKKGGKNYDAAWHAYGLLIGDKGTDALLPKELRLSMENQAPKLEAMGRRAIQILENSMSNDQVEAIAKAIADGIPMMDPNFPKPQGLAFDPNNALDVEIMKKMKDKKEDGLAYLDALADFAKFQEAMRRGVSHHTYINPTIDGKTNGPASNAMQMGDREGLMRTGVLRSENSIYAVDMDEDIRDKLQQILNEALDTGLQGHFPDWEDEFVVRTLLDSAFNTRDLNKKITMTFGYGKEIESFGPEIEETLYLNAQNDPLIAAALQYLDDTRTRIKPEDVTKIALQMYLPAVQQVMSADGIEARRLMWGAAFFHALADEVLEIVGPTGVKLRYGGNQSDPTLTKDLGTYKIEGKQRRVYQYQNKATAGAERKKYFLDDAGNEIEVKEVGGRAWGGSVPGPVQAIDAATVVKTFSGKSWKRLKQVSGGNPYVHQIYDAFKFDLDSFAAGMEEVNKNWAEINMNWSYLAELQTATHKATQAFHEKLKAMPDGELNLDEHFPMIRYLLDTDGLNPDWDMNNPGIPHNLYKKVMKLTPDHVFSSNVEKQKWVKGKVRQLITQLRTNTGAETMTKAQIQHFYKELMKMTRYAGRVNELRVRTDKNKAALRKEIFDPKNGIYQYYAH